MIHNHSIPNGQYPPTYLPTDLSPGSQKSAVTPPLMGEISFIGAVPPSLDHDNLGAGAKQFLGIHNHNQNINDPHMIYI
jgi:hypothetical protein